MLKATSILRASARCLNTEEMEKLCKNAISQVKPSKRTNGCETGNLLRIAALPQGHQPNNFKELVKPLKKVLKNMGLVSKFSRDDVKRFKLAQ